MPSHFFDTDTNKKTQAYVQPWHGHSYFWLFIYYKTTIFNTSKIIAIKVSLIQLLDSTDFTTVNCAVNS